MTTTTTADPEQLVRVRSGRYDRIGLAVVLFAGALLVLLGARLVTGPVAVVVSALLLVTIVGYIIVAITGGPEARRRLAPYGLLQPGILWLALFYLAPLFTLLRTSLSTLPSRFAVEAEFDWNFEQLRGRPHRLRRPVPAQLRLRRHRHGPVPRHRLPDGVRHRLPRRSMEEPLARTRHCPVLHVLPDPHDRLAEPARRQRTDHRSARTTPPHRSARDVWESWTTAGCSTPGRRSSAA